MNKDDFKKHCDVVHQAIELLERADEILALLIEVKIPELINKTSNVDVD